MRNSCTGGKGKNTCTVKSRHKEKRSMKEKMNYVAVNMRPECDPSECLECPFIFFEK